MKMIKFSDLNNKLKIRSLSFKLVFAFVIFITVPLLINGLLTFSKTKNVLESRINSYVQSTLSFISSDVNNIIKEYDLRFVDFYSRKKFFATLGERQMDHTDKLKDEVLLNDELETFLVNNTFFQSLYFFSNDGEIYSAEKEGGKNYSFIESFTKNLALNKEILNLKGEGLWFVINDGVTSHLCLGRVIKDIYGKFNNIGISVVTIDMKAIANICSDTNVPGDASLYILNQDNQIVYNKDGFDDISGYIKTGQINNVFKGNKGIETFTINDVDYAIIYNVSKQNNWKYIEFIEESQFTSEIFELQNHFFFITVISIIFFIIITAVVSQYIVKPIKKLAQAMNKIKNGNLDINVQIKAKDEVGILYDSFNTMRQRIKNLIVDIIDVSKREKEAEIQALKAQFNPHFLYNALGTVNWMAVKNNQFEISDMITTLSDLMRYSLDKNSGDIVTVREDIRWLNSYMNFQKMRFDKKFDVVFNVDPFVLDKKVHKLLLQPLLENSILHGLEGSRDSGLIIINVYNEQNNIIIEIKDNGIGMEEEKIRLLDSDENPGMGIKNVRERLRLYYGDACKLELKSKIGSGTTICLLIPSIE